MQNRTKSNSANIKSVAGRDAGKGDSALTPGNKLGILRKHLRLTQVEWARKLGMSRGSISSYEIKGNASPPADLIRKIAQDQGVDLAWFYDGEDTPPAYSKTLTLDVSGVKRPDVGFVLPIWLFRSEALTAAGEPIYRPTLSVVPVPESLNMADITHMRLLRVAGQSLGGRAQQGSEIAFKMEPNPPVDSIVLVGPRTPPELKDWGATRWFVRKLVVGQGNQLMLRSYVDGSEIPIDDDNLQIWGAAVLINKPYKPGEPNTEDNRGQFLPG